MLGIAYWVSPTTFEASYFPVRHVRARATWRIARPLRAYVGFDWDSERDMLADRSSAGSPPPSRTPTLAY